MRLSAIERGEAQLSDYIEPSTDSRAIREKEKQRRAVERRKVKEEQAENMPAQMEFMAMCVDRAGGICALSRATGLASGSISSWRRGKSPISGDKRETLEKYLDYGEVPHADNEVGAGQSGTDS